MGILPVKITQIWNHHLDTNTHMKLASQFNPKNLRRTTNFCFINENISGLLWPIFQPYPGPSLSAFSNNWNLFQISGALRLHWYHWCPYCMYIKSAIDTILTSTNNMQCIDFYDLTVVSFVLHQEQEAHGRAKASVTLRDKFCTTLPHSTIKFCRVRWSSFVK